MKLIDDLLRDNLATLRTELGGLKQLAEKLERDDSQVSQWLNGLKNSGTGKPRGMRSDTARYIESKCGKTEGWLDIDHVSISGSAKFGFSTTGTLTDGSNQARPLVNTALGATESVAELVAKLGAALSATDPITREQSAPILVQLSKTPELAAELGARLEATIKMGTQAPFTPVNPFPKAK
jgi:hypothetical protein